MPDLEEKYIKSVDCTAAGLHQTDFIFFAATDFIFQTVKQIGILVKLIPNVRSSALR